MLACPRRGRRRRRPGHRPRACIHRGRPRWSARRSAGPPSSSWAGSSRAGGSLGADVLAARWPARSSSSCRRSCAFVLALCVRGRPAADPARPGPTRPTRTAAGPPVAAVGLARTGPAGGDPDPPRLQPRGDRLRGRLVGEPAPGHRGRGRLPVRPRPARHRARDRACRSAARSCRSTATRRSGTTCRSSRSIATPRPTTRAAGWTIVGPAAGRPADAAGLAVATSRDADRPSWPSG